ncbi:MAG: SDR family NAD(P)-dependent oxidoreductase [Chloroflexi bacterium]|nr:SDR family NAD(P)-dependent oxidoreductase [Chloroflexota bacterium]
MRLKGKVAIITGGGSGIGGAIATRFAAEGASVVIADLDPVRSGNLIKQIEAGGGKATFAKMDAMKYTDAVAMVETAVKTYGKLDILVNNVGGGKGDTLEELDEETWDWNMNFALKPTFLCSKAAMPELLKSKGAAIVNIASINGLLGIGLEAYAAAKAGVVMLTKNLAVKYGPKGVRSNVIAPGTTRTDFWIPAEKADPTIFDRIATVYPMGRVARPDDIANAALYLASDEASFVNGALLPVDGGFTAGTDAFDRAARAGGAGDDIWGKETTLDR